MTLYIIGITVLISLAAFSSRDLKERLMLNPYAMKREKQWYRYITSGFIHDDEVHLLANMFTLYMFGEYVDFFYGALFGKNAWLIYCILYITSIFAANVSTYLKYQDSSGYRSLGASGATSAIVFTAILYKPYLQIWGLPGFIMGIAYLAYSYYAGRKGGDHINHEAHLYGAIYGVLFTIVLKPIVAQIFFNQLF